MINRLIFRNIAYHLKFLGSLIPGLDKKVCIVVKLRRNYKTHGGEEKFSKEFETLKNNKREMMKMKLAISQVNKTHYGKHNDRQDQAKA